MSLTRNQIHERLGSLSGALKAAHTNRNNCAADVEAKDRMAEIARQALEKAEAGVKALEDERAELASQYAAAALQVGEVPMADETPAPALVAPDGQPSVFGGFNSVFSEPADFQAQALQNGAERIEQAFNEATGR